MWGRCKVHYLRRRTPNNPAFTIFYKRRAFLYYQNACGSNQKLWNSNYRYGLLQQGQGNLEADSEETDFSQES